MDRVRRLIRGVSACGVLALALGAGGCAVSYETYPSDGAIGLQNPDLGSVRAVSGIALASVVGESKLRSADGRFAINLPPRMSQNGRREVAERVGRGAEPVTAENAQTLPVYHVGRVWVRGGNATVDVLAPRSADVDPTLRDRYDYDGYSVYLEGGLRPWRYVRARRWAPGTLDVPPLDFGLPVRGSGAGSTSAATSGAGAGGEEASVTEFREPARRSGPPRPAPAPPPQSAPERYVDPNAPVTPPPAPVATTTAPATTMTTAPAVSTAPAGAPAPETPRSDNPFIEYDIVPERPERMAETPVREITRTEAERAAESPPAPPAFDPGAPAAGGSPASGPSSGEAPGALPPAPQPSGLPRQDDPTRNLPPPYRPQ